MKSSVSAIILAAGQSKRMNRPKPFLAFNEMENFIEKIGSTYLAAGIEKAIVIVNPDIEREVSVLLKNKFSDSKLEVVVNSYPEKGRFYSIQLGLEKTDTDSCFIQNTDNPFVTKDLLNNMCRMIKQGAYVVPVFKNEKGHPVIISAEVMNHCRKLNGNDFNLSDELQMFEEIRLVWDEKNILANINTEDEYQKYFPSCEAFTK